VSRRFAFEPEARETYLALRKDPSSALYLALKEVLSEILADPGSRRGRQVRYRPDPDLIEIHYLGPAPGET
jgi:hypothetical protein